MATILVGGAIFFAATAAAFVLMRAAVRRPAAAFDAGPAGPRLAGFAPDLADAVPFTAAGRDELRAKLAAAGEYRPGAAAGLVAGQVLLAGGLLVVAIAACLFAPPRRTPWVLGAGVVLSLGGYFGPRLLLSARAKSRRSAVESGLPLALDLLAVVLTAGGDVRGGLMQVARAVRRPHPVLAEEITLVGRHAELFSLGHAVKMWADRGGVPAVRDFARLIAHAESTGAGIAAAVAGFAGRMRAADRTRAEAKANRLGLWLLLVTLSCFWTSTAILMIAPAATLLATSKPPSQIAPAKLVSPAQ